MRVAVTGASGFIGRTLVVRLVERGHEVIALTHRQSSEPTRVEGVSSRTTELGKIRIATLGDAEVVVHLAGLAHGATRSRDDIQRVNVGGTVAVANAARMAGARLVFLSSVKVHGDESRVPFDEASALSPGDPYAQSKAVAEAALRGVDGLQSTIIRPPLVYGPGVRANFLALMRAVDRRWPLPFSSIENVRSLLYVGSLVDAIVGCVESPRAVGRTYLVADGRSVSTPELCRVLGAALGRPARLFPFPVPLLELVPPLRKLTRSLEVDDSAIRRELGWTPPYTFEQGVRATAEWYLRETRTSRG